MNNHGFIAHDKITEIDQQVTESFQREQLYSALTSTESEQNLSENSGDELLFERRQRERKDGY